MGPGGFIDSPELGDTALIHPAHDGTPLFNGDPLLHRLDFGKDAEGHAEVRLSSRIPRTPCFYTDQACLTDDRWRDYRYDNRGLARFSLKNLELKGLGFRNEINTAVIPMRFCDRDGYRLLLTWDAGRPFEIDPVSLEIATAIGYDRDWKEQVELPVPFGIVMAPAHPAFAPSDAAQGRGAQLFSVNFGKSIGTFLHPILHGCVDDPYTIKDEETLATIQRYVSLGKRMVWGLDLFLKILRPLVRLSPSWLRRFGKNRVRQLSGFGCEVLRPTAGEPLELNRRLIFSRTCNLINLSLSRDGDPSRPDQEPSLQNNLNAVQGLMNAAQKLLGMTDMGDFVRLIRWDGDKPLQAWQVVDQDGHPLRIMQTMHQIGVTEDYVILMDTVFKMGIEQLMTSPLPGLPDVERMVRRLLDYRQGDHTVLYIVKRSDLDNHQNAETVPDLPADGKVCIDENEPKVQAKRVVIPNSMAHFQVDYKNPGNRITLHCVHNKGWDAAEWVRPYDQIDKSPFPSVVGMASAGTDISVMAKYCIDGESGRLLGEGEHAKDDQNLTWMLALCTMCQPDGVSPPDQIRDLFWNGWGCHGDLMPTYIQKVNAAAKDRTLSIEEAGKLASDGLPATLVRLETETMTIKDSYVFPAGLFGNSVQFVPRPAAVAGGADGYLMCVVNGGDDPETSEFWIFDAEDLARGPLCRLGHPEVKIGMTIHSTWVPGIQPRSASYQVSVKEDYDEKLQRIAKEKELQPLFEQHVYPHF